MSVSHTKIEDVDRPAQQSSPAPEQPSRAELERRVMDASLEVKRLRAAAEEAEATARAAWENLKAGLPEMPADSARAYFFEIAVTALVSGAFCSLVTYVVMR